MKQLIWMVALLALGFSGLALADSSRFTVTEPVSGEQVVTDAVTGLMWQKSYATSKTWKQALAYCESLSYGGYSDWRLPNVQELSSLVNSARYNPASDFPDMPSSYFWSSSSDANFYNFACYVYFGNGYVASYYKTSYDDARCVRLGP